MPLKIAIIGAGSIGFARRLFRDVLSVPELQDTHFALHDISSQNLGMVRQLCEKDLKTNKVPATISASTDRRKSLDGADYIINCTRVGVQSGCTWHSSKRIPLAANRSRLGVW